MKVNLNRIRGLMAEHGDTQRDLADKLNVSVTTIGNYLNGKTQMTVELVGEVAKAYNVTPVFLLAEKE